MNRAVLIASLLLAAAPAAATASPAPAGKRPPPPPSKAQTIMVRMLAALHHKSRIQASGWSSGKAQPRTRYVIRYEATGREDYQASMAHTKQSQASAPGSLHYILMGTTVYSHVASRWYKLRGSTTPDAADVLSLGANGASCCTATGLRGGTSVALKGTAHGPGGTVYVINFRAGSALGGSFGTIDISTATHLPTSYTVTTRPLQTATSGTFAVSYGGNFDIRAPQT